MRAGVTEYDQPSLDCRSVTSSECHLQDLLRTQGEGTGMILKKNIEKEDIGPYINCMTLYSFFIAAPM
jgi:hypothetical protein